MTGLPDRNRADGAARPPRRADRSGLVVAISLAALAAVLTWDASHLPEAGGYSGMGPADTPRLLALGLAGLAVWTGWEAIRNPAQPVERPSIPPLLWIVGGLGLQLLLFRSAGFSVAGGILFACTAAAFGRRRLWLTFPAGVLLALAIFGIFGVVLELSLPAGPLERMVYGV